MTVIKTFKYLIEFLIIIFFFIIFKIIGIKLSSFISGKIFSIVGPLFRSKKTINQNMFIALPNKSSAEIEKYKNNMWNYYGKILAEYPFLNKFRNDESKKYIIIDGENYLEEIKSKNESVIFISGHFDNFELMALCLEKNKINLSAIYRPLNNIFLNKIMEYLRKKYICKNQIKKGRSGIRELIQLFKSGSSIALMIDQRVSEGIKSEFFGKKAYTTTIPAQFFKKFNCKIVPIHIERGDTIKFRLKVFKPIQFNQNDSIENITDELNLWLQNRIQKNPSQWIWTHNRWK